MTTRRLPKNALLMLICAPLLAAGVAVRIGSLSYGFPDVYYIDEDAVVESALYTMTGDLDPHLYKYPHLVVNILALAFRARLGIGFGAEPESVSRAFVAYQEDPHPITLLARGIVLTLSLLAIPLTFFAGWTLWGFREGILAATLLALSPLHVGLSRIARVDAPAASFVAAAILLSVWYHRSGRTRDLVGAGLAAGAAAGCKYFPGLIAVVPVLILWERGGAIGSRVRATLVVGVSSFAAFCASSPALIVGFRDSLPALLGLTRYVHETPFRDVPGQSTLLRFAPEIVRSSIGWGGWLCVLAFVVFAVARRTAATRAEIITTLAYPLVLLCLFLRPEMFFPRFTVSAFPPLCLAAARGAALIASREMWRGAAARIAPIIAPAGLVAASIPFLHDSAETALRTLRNEDTRVMARKWIESNLPAEQPVLLQHRRLAPFFPTKQLPFAHPPDELLDRLAPFSPQHEASLRAASGEAAAAVPGNARAARYWGGRLADGLRELGRDAAVVVSLQPGPPEKVRLREEDFATLENTHRRAAWFPGSGSDAFGPPIGVWIPKEDAP